MVRYCLLIAPILFFYTLSFGQEQLVHEKKVYINSDNQIFINKSVPIYFRISTSPDANAPSYILPSSSTPKYANPMYLDTEGLNTLHSPSAVDPVTKEVVIPLQNVVFDINADGQPPVSKLLYQEAQRYVKNKAIFFGKGIKISIPSKDADAGTEGSYISIDKNGYQLFNDFKNEFSVEKEYELQYYSVDYVGNVELPRTETFIADYTAPATEVSVLGENSGKALSSKAAITLTSKDTLSGVKNIMVSINDGVFKVYTAPIPMALLADGESKIKYYSIDNVGNKEDDKIISISNESNNGGDLSGFSFYIDKEPPVMSFEIMGDQYKGANLFMSERSEFKIMVSDEKSGVAEVTCNVNGAGKTVYTQPFKVAKSGLNTISYASTDYVGNIALSQAQQVYVDKITPQSKLSYSGKSFVNRDTTFINKDTRIVLSATDAGSGVKSIKYSIDAKANVDFSTPITVESEGLHYLDYYCIDQVNNEESVRKTCFVVDNTPPQIHHNFSVKAIGEKIVRESKYIIYPSNVLLYMAATDNTAGVERLEYSINGGALQTTTPISGLKPGNYEIKMTVYDTLKNKHEEIIRFAVEN